MYQKLLADSSLPAALREIDRLWAEKQAEAGCRSCGGTLHRASYPRKPRGPWRMGRELRRRESFCCESCRRRLTPESVVYFGRRWYVGPVVVLVAALCEGPTPWRMARIREVWDVSAETVRIWRRWWGRQFPRSAYWRAARGYFPGPISEVDLPFSLVEVFGVARGERERLMALLRWLSPVTTRPWLCARPFCGTV